jgi:hypothetical protein
VHVVLRRLHVARNVYKQALALIKASRENDGGQADDREALS